MGSGHQRCYLFSPLLLFLSSPVLICVSYIFVYFYYLTLLQFASDWFVLCPSLLMSCSCICLLTSLLSVPLLVSPSTSRPIRYYRIVVQLLLLMQTILAAITSWGCTELRSLILQEIFSTINTGEVLHQYVSDGEYRQGWDDLQRTYLCCGTVGYNRGWEDWRNKLNGSEEMSVPDSCCHMENLGCGHGVLSKTLSDSPHIHKHGCLTVLQVRLTQELSSLLLYLTVLTAVIAGLSLTLCYLIRLAYIRNSQDETLMKQLIFEEKSKSHEMNGTPNECGPDDWSPGPAKGYKSHNGVANGQKPSNGSRPSEDSTDLYTTKLSSPV